MEIETSDGIRLTVERRVPPGPPRGAALLLHAMMVDRRSMDRGLADLLVDRGWEVFLADFRGRRGLVPAWSYDDLVRLDLPALVASVRQETPLPLVVLGHSLGGHVTVAALAEERVRVDALVLLAANVWLPCCETSRRRRLLKGGAMRLAGAVTRLAGHFPARRLRIGPVDEAAPYFLDLAGFWHRDAWTARDGTDWLDGMRTVDVPALAVIAEGDRLLAHRTGARSWAARLPDVELWEVGGHGIGHMGLVTSSRSRPIWARIEAWMSERVPARYNGPNGR